MASKCRTAGPALLLFLLTICLGACGSSSTTVVGPSGDKCSVSVSSSPSSFPPGGGSGTVSVSTTRDCSWSVAITSPWVSLSSPASGRGNASVAFSVASNPAAASRSAGIQVNGQEIQIAQEPAPCRFQLDHAAESVAARGGGGSVTVSAPQGCAWSSSSRAGWIVVQGGATGGGRATFTVAANAGGARSATLTIAGQPFTVSQATGVPAPGPTPPAPPKPTPPPACRVGVSPSNQAVNASGGSFSIAVTAGTGCEWSADSQVGWLSLSRPRGSGNGTIGVTAAQNTATSSRTGSVVIAGQNVTVTQAGVQAVEVQGDVSQRSGSCPAITFVVGATTIVTTSDTSFTGGACGDVGKGAKVKVTGVPHGDTVTATDVQIQKKGKG